MKEIKEYLLDLDKLRTQLASLHYQQDKTYQTLIDRIMINCRTDIHPSVLEHLNKTRWIKKIGYWVHDLKGHIFMATKELLLFLGADPNQASFSEDQFFNQIHQDDLPRILKSYPQDILAHEERSSAYRINSFNSELKYVISNFSCKYDSDDRPSQVTGVIFEIPQTDSKKAHNSNEYINEIIKANMGVGFWEYNPEDNQEYWSSSLYDIIETTPAENPPLFSTLQSVITEKYSSKSIEVILENNKTNTDYGLSFKITTFKGNEKYLYSQVHHLLDSEGKLLKRYGLIYDITQMKHLLIK